MPIDLLSDQELNKLRVSQPERFQANLQGGDYIDLRELDLQALPEMEIERLKRLAAIMRGLIFAAVEAGQSGHPGGSSSKVEMLLALTLSGVMAFDPLNPKHVGRDRVVWSAGHCTPGLYSILSLFYECLRRAGRQFSEAVVRPVFPEHLLRFRHVDGPQGHAEAGCPLSDVSTGPSGHGLSAAGGIATAHQSSGLDTKVFVMMGDAESEEGMTYEARNMFATIGLKNLIVTLDYNHFGIDAEIEEVVNSPYINHWLGLGWNVIETNGHDVLEMAYAYRLAAKGFANGKPIVILAHAFKGNLYGKMHNTAASHGSPAKHEEYIEIMKALGFDIPGIQGNVMADIEKVLEALTLDDQNYILTRLEAGAEKIKPERELVKIMEAALPGRAFVKPTDIRRPAELPPELIFAEGTKVATRKATQAWFKWLMKETAWFYAGAGDLAKSILTNSAEEVYGLINQTNPLGRGLRFGIAEQNMAMFSAAMTQDVLPGGFQPVSVFSTYAVFTSMMANSVRLAIIGNYIRPETKGFFIMLAAHDGPETGEDGPTHHGLFWMSMYNAYPGIKVYKPMDANETVEMLFHALEIGEPVAFSVARPDTLVLDRIKDGAPPAREAINGAYVYRQFKNNGHKKVVLAVCGGQTMINTLAAIPDLEQQGLDIKVLAVTSPELFEDLRKNDPAKAEAIFPDSERAITVAIHNGWPGFLYPFILPAGYVERSIGINRYLKSGKVDELYELAEMLPGDIVKKVMRGITD
ncbi:MAG: thiamine pyrophosphate-dependent enzyme [bacterium]|nr:thiamine pyrophosphate-dependent enzyme [bacterium]